MSDAPKKKPGSLSPEQLAALKFRKRLDFSGNDWLELYLSEFPKEEQRDVESLRRALHAGLFVMHETRSANGQLLSWSISQDFPAPPGTDHPSFWMGCWTVTRREVQGTGIGKVHFAKVLEALKTERPTYFGRFTEIEATAGLTADSQPVRRARFYKSLGLSELDAPYEMARFQPSRATRHYFQSEMQPKVAAQLLVSPFGDAPIRGKQLAYVIARMYEEHYEVKSCDPYVAERLKLINKRRKNLLIPMRIPGVTNDARTAQPTCKKSVDKQLAPRRKRDRRSITGSARKAG